MADPIEMLKKAAAKVGGQAILAQRIGVSPQYVSMVIKGHRRPSLKILEWLDLEPVATLHYRRRK